MKNSSVFILFLIVSFGIGICPSNAQETITFGPGETKIIGSIPYSVIGKYEAQFSVFKGRITVDEKSHRVQSVYLDIQASSIRSNCPWCDRIARSRRLLYTTRYPEIIFKSDELIRDQSGYQVRGILEMHGIKRRMTFPFNESMMIDRKTKREVLVLKGSWHINRKGFNIVWNKALDHGGVLVGDNFTVDWGIRMYNDSIKY